MPKVMLKRSWPSPEFRRTIGGEVLVFVRDLPQEVTAAQRKALEPDILKALVDVDEPEPKKSGKSKADKSGDE